MKININGHNIEFTAMELVNSVLGIIGFLLLFTALWVVTPA